MRFNAIRLSRVFPPLAYDAAPLQGTSRQRAAAHASAPRRACTLAGGHRPAWSPDSTHIAFTQVTANRPSTTTTLTMLDVGTRQGQVLFYLGAAPRHFAVEAAFHPSLAPPAHT